MQNVQIRKYRTKQGGESSLLYHVQLLWLSKIGHSHQDRVLCPDRQTQAAAGLSGDGCYRKGRHVFILTMGLVWPTFFGVPSIDVQKGANVITRVIEF